MSRPPLKLIAVSLAVPLYIATVVAVLPLAVRIAAPLTHESLARTEAIPFPVLVMHGANPRVELRGDTRSRDLLGAGESFLVPRGRTSHVAASLQKADGRDWVLNVSSLANDRQRIELFVMDDGWWGGAYEATAKGITPLYIMSTGPGFAFVFGPLSILMAAVLWAGAFLAFRRLSRSRTNRQRSGGHVSPA